MGEYLVRHPETDDDLRAALRSIFTAFLSGKDVKDEWVTWVAEQWDRSRCWLAVDDGEVCGTARTFASGLRLPGLSSVPVSCLTSVTVLPTHTRRGHLGRMMREQLLAAVEAGEIASLLVAAEWPIYGRFGYGPYSSWAEWEVDRLRATVVGERVGTCRLVDAAELEKVAASVVARQQAATPGSIERPDVYNAWNTGADPRPWDSNDGRVRVVHDGADGEPDAFAMYDVKDRWDGMRPQSRIEIADLVAVSPVAEKELWRYLVDVDLVDVVKWPGDPGSALRYALTDGRAARLEGTWDHIWARPLDVAACLSARSYTRSERLVLEVVDGFLGRGGTFVLETDGEVGSCVAAGAGAASADLTLDVAALGAIWVGGTDLRALAAGGGLWSVDEHTPGAVERAAALFRWHQDPYCSTEF
jgi:predicted acetyltransferase